MPLDFNTWLSQQPDPGMDGGMANSMLQKSWQQNYQDYLQSAGALPPANSPISTGFRDLMAQNTAPFAPVMPTPEALSGGNDASVGKGNGMGPSSLQTVSQASPGKGLGMGPSNQQSTTQAAPNGAGQLPAYMSRFGGGAPTANMNTLQSMLQQGLMGK